MFDFLIYCNIQSPNFCTVNLRIISSSSTSCFSFFFFLLTKSWWCVRLKSTNLSRANKTRFFRAIYPVFLYFLRCHMEARGLRWHRSPHFCESRERYLITQTVMITESCSNSSDAYQRALIYILLLNKKLSFQMRPRLVWCRRVMHYLHWPIIILW